MYCVSALVGLGVSRKTSKLEDQGMFGLIAEAAKLSLFPCIAQARGDCPSVFKLGGITTYPKAYQPTNGEIIRSPTPLKIFRGLYLKVRVICTCHAIACCVGLACLVHIKRLVCGCVCSHT